MKAAALVVAFVLLGSCTFAQKHPGITVGIVAGSIGAGACGLAVGELDKCAAVGGIAGVVLGGITGLVTMFADTSAHTLDLEDEETDGVVRTRAEPPPGLPDAGVGSAAADAGVPSDASNGQLDAAP